MSPSPRPPGSPSRSGSSSASRPHEPPLSGPDRTVLQFTVAVATGPHVSDELFAALRSVLSEREVVEMLHVVGYYWTLSRVSTVAQIEATHLYAREYGTDWPREADL